MKYIIIHTNKFDKQVRLLVKRGYNIELLKNAIKLLANSGSLPAHYRPHKLKGSYAGFWECHIQPDWLLVWK